MPSRNRDSTPSSEGPVLGTGDGEQHVAIGVAVVVRLGAPSRVHEGFGGLI
jgi:hypothetical protein